MQISLVTRPNPGWFSLPSLGLHLLQCQFYRACSSSLPRFPKSPSYPYLSPKAMQTYLSIISGLGFPVAFLSAPVITIAPATLKPNPRIPQFISHSLSAIVQVPPPLKRRLLVIAGLWCEYKPSISIVQKIMHTRGNKQAITPAQAAEIRSGSAYGYCNDSLFSENRWWKGSAISSAEKARMKNLGRC